MLDAVMLLVPSIARVESEFGLLRYLAQPLGEPPGYFMLQSNPTRSYLSELLLVLLHDYYTCLETSYIEVCTL